MSNRDVVDKFYKATQSGDAAAILAALHPRFEGWVAPGMPSVEVTQAHGPEAALAGIWGPVFRDFAIAPFAEEWFDGQYDTVIVTGHYRGTARATGKHVTAEFAHIWHIADGKLLALHQYTDTWYWREALSAAA
ncbi:nuclear transport factor 2 family protein [Nocardia sp. NPDC005998]|uniref:nuclear transport factor 2 family protein n=1 Tax=Nocardia sp. NPDC005998 TaxID=3156894 RepID=UPI0033BC7493